MGSVWERIEEKSRDSSKGIHPAQLTPGNGGLKQYPRQGNLLAVKKHSPVAAI
jgi:hypothetical protein